MNQNILHVGLDVDDTQYHGSAFNQETGEVIDFRCRPTAYTAMWSRPAAFPVRGKAVKTDRSAGGVWSAHRGTGGHAAVPGGRAVADLLQRYQEYLRSDYDHRDR